MAGFLRAAEDLLNKVDKGVVEALGHNKHLGELL
jgi:hypothetical protein